MEIVVLILVGLLFIAIGLLIGKNRKTTQPTTVTVDPAVARPLARIDGKEPAYTPMPGWDAVAEDPPTVDWGQVLLHAGAIVLVQLLLGLVFGIALAALPQGQFVGFLGLISVLSTLVGLTIAGVLAHGDIGKHILLVGLLLWLFALTNVFLIGTTFGQWFLGVFVIGLCALVAWGISKAIRGKRKM